MRRTLAVLAALLLAAPAAVADPYNPPWVTNVEGTGMPGLNGGAHLMLWNAPGNFEDAPTLRIDRHVDHGSGQKWNTYKGLWVLGSSGADNAGFEWTITGELHNKSRASTGSQNVAVNGTIFRESNGVSPTGPSWALNGNCVDTSGETNPTAGCIAAELDVSASAGGGDPNRQRVGAHIAASGPNGTHVGYGVVVSGTPGVTFDRAFSTGNVGASFGIGLDLSGGTYSKQAIAIPANNWIALDGDGNGGAGHYLGYYDGQLGYLSPGGWMLRIDDTGLVTAGRFAETFPHAPGSSGSACVTGEHAWDQGYEYRCVSTNHWKRSALSDF